jgi:putative Mg2+ transporter-C (MgtC) family protein
MPVFLSWHEVALRRGLSVVGSAIIGLNRDESGRPAGLRTTILVCLAACMAMIQANLLMSSAGKPQDSFVVLDLMRLPLGILTGIGFIGAGAIVRKGSLVTGVTTAATLWFDTVIGLCFGGGQLALGIAGVALAVAVLWNMKWVESLLPRVRQATLTLEFEGPQADENEIRRLLRAAGCRVDSWAAVYHRSGPPVRVECVISWKSPHNDPEPPDAIKQLAAGAGVAQLEFRP